MTWGQAVPTEPWWEQVYTASSSVSSRKSYCKARFCCFQLVVWVSTITILGISPSNHPFHASFLGVLSTLYYFANHHHLPTCFLTRSPSSSSFTCGSGHPSTNDSSISSTSWTNLNGNKVKRCSEAAKGGCVSYPFPVNTFESMIFRLRIWTVKFPGGKLPSLKLNIILAPVKKIQCLERWRFFRVFSRSFSQEQIFGRAPSRLYRLKLFGLFWRKTKIHPFTNAKPKEKKFFRFGKFMLSFPWKPLSAIFCKDCCFVPNSQVFEAKLNWNTCEGSIPETRILGNPL